jgi:hypothetical protein
MARWEIFTEKSGNVRVQYVALRPIRRVFDCGLVRADTAPEDIVKFIVERGEAKPLDLICFMDSGVVLPMLPAAMAGA